ncbi:MAG: hypothetical protein IKJ89_09115, partial [Kiritimatiellae bacterium]|nr:hypothetical protein [Kiritimatiellia bacterium]
GVFALNLHAEVSWTTGSCAPSSWAALSDNLLADETGSISGAIATGYSTNDPDLLTDVSVPTGSGNGFRVGFQNNASITWTFLAPKTLDYVRVSCGYLDSVGYSGFTVSSIEVQTFGSSVWTPLNTTAGQMADTRQGEILSLTLADGSDDPLAETVGALRVTFGAPPVGFANYCVEIEAVGSAEATGPVLGSFDITPAKTKAKVSGSIADVGTDATACDVYLALDGGAATKIAEGVTGSFEYRLQGLTAGTTYAYELSVSNDAPTAKGTVRSGTFTTLAADAQTMTWATEDVAPSSWTALSGNLLAGLTGTLGGQIATDYSTDDPDLLTDATVPTAAGAAYIVGFQNSASVEWAFTAPKAFEKLRISACYLAGNAYTRLAVTGVYVKLANSASWDALDAPVYSDIGGRSQSVVLCATLSDSETGYLSQGIVGLKLVFGNVGALASYCAEIEAVGAAEITGPSIGALEITPAKTKAKVSGSISDPGTDATACDVYLALDGGTARKIASGVTDSFEYQVAGLTAGTTYAYELSVSNNAPTAKGTVRNGTFTTLSAESSTAFWTTSEGVPGDFSPLANNLISNKVGTTTGTISGYGGGVDLLTNGEVSGETKQTCGFGENATVSWTFDKPKTVEKIRFTTCYTAGNAWYDDIKISKVEVKPSGSDSWTDLGVAPLDYAGSGTAGVALFATLADAEYGFLAQDVTALRITFGKPNNVAQYYAEIEAVGPKKKTGVVILVR